ncbi:MAG TPA: efflux RND transporter periplasmic adaptor subunit [Bacteroidetes bacterium]|nr:efflux RND transporter periplasmic adaptor subunit [Bacteroidota bacterium]
MRKALTILTAIAITALLFSGCDKSGSSDDQKDESIPVRVAPVKLSNVIQTLIYDGDIKAEFEVKVFSKIPDRIEKFFVDEGDKVQKGNPIAKITATTIEQGVHQAEAGLVSAKVQESNLLLEFDRARRLNRENAMSMQQYDAIKTQYEAVKAQVQQAEAALKSVKSQLNDATVTAPISGIIGSRFYEAGDMANPAIPLVTIVQMNRVKIIFEATEEDLGILSVGQKVDVVITSYTGEKFSGKITKISPVLDPLTRMAKVEVIINNPDRKLKPGMYAHIEVITGVLENVIVVPRYTVIESTTMEKVHGEDRVVKNYYIFIADSNKAQRRKLNVIYVNHQNLAVSSGVKAGEQLITMGQNYLRDGAAIRISQEGGDIK